MKLNNFKVQELVPKSVYDIHGDDAIFMMDKSLLDFIDNFKADLEAKFGGKISIVANDWLWDGIFQYRGLRTISFYNGLSNFNRSRSQHKYGRALDFDVYCDGKRILPSLIVNLIVEKFKEPLYDKITFIETGVNWVHIDTRANEYGDLVLWNAKTGTTRLIDRGNT